MTTAEQPNLNQVPDGIKVFFEALPECYDRAKDQHRPADDGRCYCCGHTSPCEYESWLKILPRPPIPPARRSLIRKSRPWHHARPSPPA